MWRPLEPGGGAGQGLGRAGWAPAVLGYLQGNFPEWLGRLGAAASTANLLDDVEGHACGEAGGEPLAPMCL